MGKEIKFKCDRNKDNLLDYLLVKTAPVLTGIKPAILLRLCKCRHIRKMTHYDSFLYSSGRNNQTVESGMPGNEKRRQRYTSSVL